MADYSLKQMIIDRHKDVGRKKGRRSTGKARVYMHEFMSVDRRVFEIVIPTNEGNLHVLGTCNAYDESDARQSEQFYQKED